MKNIEYIMKNNNLSNLKYSICRICYIDKHSIDCDGMCCNCEFNIALSALEYLEAERIEKIKLSKLEYDMIASYTVANDNTKFNAFQILRKLKEKGHFKEVDENLTLKQIKERAVVVDER